MTARNHRSLTDRGSLLLLRLVDCGLASVVFVAPLFMGGRHPLGKLVFVSIVGATSVAWMAGQWLNNRARWRWSGAEVLLVLGIALNVIQLAPLPQSWLLSLSPDIGELLPLWIPPSDAAPTIGNWRTLSLTPIETRGGLVILAAYGMLFLVLMQRLQHLADIERLLRWIALGTAGMAIIALGQLFAGNGKFLWLYEHPFREAGGTAKAAFSNQNHFAHFLALGIGPWIWWLYQLHKAVDGRERDNPLRFGKKHSYGEYGKVLVPVALGVLVVAGLLSFSRGGVIAMAFAATVTIFVFGRRSLLSRRSLAALVGIAAIVVLAIAINGHQPLAKELQTIRGGFDEMDREQGRRKLWAADIAAAHDFPIFGTGVGSHREVYPVYYADYSPVEFTHAESGYVQVFLETGFVGLLLLLTVIAVCGRWCLAALRQGGKHKTSTRIAACAAAIFAGLMVSSLHSLVDFMWYIPACLSFTVMFAACACRLAQMNLPSQKTPAKIPRTVSAAATIALLACTVLMIVDRLPTAFAAEHWDRYLAHSLKDVRSLDHDRASPEITRSMMNHLSRTLQNNPNDTRAHLRLAAASVQMFELEQQNSPNRMSLAQIREAALAAQFASLDDQDRWLKAAIGDNRRYLDQAVFHVQEALQRCPLQGEGYIYLSKLAFLESPANPTLNNAYVKQAFKVRPYKGIVLMEAAQQFAAAGDVVEALRLWKRAFREPEIQSRMIRTLAPRVSAQFFFDNFEMDMDVTERLFDHYRTAGRTDQARGLGQRLVTLIEAEAPTQTTEEAAALWIRAQRIYAFLEEDARVVDCARRVVELVPHDYTSRRKLADILVRQSRFDEAVRHIQWCLARNPDNRELQAQLELARNEERRRRNRD